MGRRTHHSPHYLNINNDLYSVDPSGVPWASPAEVRGTFYIHDSDNVGRTSFYGMEPRCMISYAVNAGASTPKVFDSCSLFSSPHAPASMQVRTKSQLSQMTPFQSTEPWKAPAYKEGAWRMPFLRADAVVGGQDSGVASYIRGEWMRVESRWNTPSELEVSSSVTEFRPSRS